MNDTPPCPNATPEWAVRCSYEIARKVNDESTKYLTDYHAIRAIAPDIIACHAPTAPRPTTDVAIETCDCCERDFAKLPDHPKKDGLARCPHCMAQGLDASRSSVPTVAPHLAGLVERLEKQAAVLRQAQIYCRSDDQEPFHWQDCVIALTEAIAALAQGARERAELASEQGRVHSTLLTVEEVAHFDENGVRGIDEQVKDLAGLYRQLQKNCLQAFDLKVEVERDLARLTTENERLAEQTNGLCESLGRQEKALRCANQLVELYRPAAMEVDDLRAQLQAATAERDEAKVQLGAWHSLFGTSQLSHAVAERDALDKEARELAGSLEEQIQLARENWSSREYLFSNPPKHIVVYRMYELAKQALAARAARREGEKP